MTDGRDFMSHSGAIELARRLRSYWLDRGFNIATTVETVPSRGRQDVWVVRSNLVGGIPPTDTKVAVMDEAA